MGKGCEHPVTVKIMTVAPAYSLCQKYIGTVQPIIRSTHAQFYSMNFNCIKLYIICLYSLDMNWYFSPC